MKLSGKGGQAALEYLQTYGWAILVVLVVGVALWQLGALGYHTTVNRATGFTNIKVLESSILYKADATDNALTFIMMNAAGIRVRAVYVTKNVSGDCSVILLNYEDVVLGKAACDGLPEPTYGVWIPPTTCWMNQPISIDPGDTAVPIYSDCISLDKGESFEVHITFRYDKRVGSGDPITYFDSGVIMGTAE